MKGVLQRVTHANVSVENRVVGNISKGFLLLLGVEKGDTEESVYALAKKVAKLRVFEDSNGKMNESLLDIGGELLVVSQFTLAGDTTKGNRPGFSDAALPEHAEALYNKFIAHFSEQYTQCQSGVFGANMQVSLNNDGPATFILNT